MTAKTHGHSRCNGGRPSTTYKAWERMMSRCYNPGDASWDRYGGCAITVCDRWFKFANFLADMGEKPVGLSLDRKDSGGDYNKENCQWATPTQQTRNRSNTVRIYYGGKEWVRAELADHAGIRWETLRARIKHGWSVERAVETPARGYV